jgi:hypothetical protein
MKKVLFILIVSALIVNSAFCQLIVNPKAGVVFSTSKMDGQQDWTAANKTGFAFGVGIEKTFGNNISFAPEILYMQKGVEQTRDMVGADDIYTFSLNYIDIPLMFRFNLGDEKLSYFIASGPYVSFLASGNVNDIGPHEGSNEKDWELQDFFDAHNYNSSSLDAGLNFGAGIKAALSSGWISGEIRYGLGFSTIGEADTQAFIFKNLESLRVFSILIGYNIEL